MDSLDKLLADLNAVDQPKPSNLDQAQTDKLLAALAAINQSRENPQSTDQSSPKSSSSKAKDPHLETLLSQLKLGYEQQELEEQKKKQVLLHQQQLAAQQQSEAIRKRRERQAKQWLKELDPLTTEGIWFTDFARNYSSLLEAVIDYLEASERG